MAKKGQSKYMPHMRAKQPAKKVKSGSAFGRSDLNLSSSIYEPKAMTPGKGQHGLNCNVTACQKPHSAWWWNNSTRAWYCADCAYEIQKVNWRDAWWIQNYDYTLMTPPGQPAIIDLSLTTEYQHHPDERYALKKPNGEVEFAKTMDEVQALLERWRYAADLRDDGELPGWYEQQLVQLRKDTGKPYVDLVGNRP